ncbi:von Willebrand factor type A [Thiorhodococcus drewsii AZ1]|uniref:von Willebrand factor type A n=1 Tax=Thiorhodococcus drewsii AZ1 TaxID=765913 RepID=G2DW33_9GAMM|nr:vWA domain-containing protein [Thiorhodococcus drewsii]EGV33939.1 von Willebrand factor type A [Thiorhodococcus drewsii AZ1]
MLHPFNSARSFRLIHGFIVSSLRQITGQRALLLILLAWFAAAEAKTPDIRILIDVSGSMRQTDPKNLRIPALQLVNELLPVGAKAGVWLFAEKTEVLAPPGNVDDKWKAKTRSRLDRIHSRGLFTDIERAIATATLGWEAPDEAYDRHLVLLTDGLVDVSKQQEKSTASRERIISNQLIKLQNARIRVDTIALSDNVDKDLLKTLAEQTNGWQETAKDADSLQRVFLHMLEQTAAPTTVPIQGNKFGIDDGVSEFTLLAFHDADVGTTLIDPDGNKISARQMAPGVVWRAEAGHDLITIANPKPGEWYLQGVSDPDNRVVVITDLGIEVGELANRVSAGTALRVETWLTDHRQPVTRPDLLKLLSATVTRTATGTQENAAPAQPKIAMEEVGEMPETREVVDAPKTLEAAPPPSNEVEMALDSKTGRFQAALSTNNLAPGDYQLECVIDGGTFKRQAVRHFKVSGPPISVEYKQRPPSEEFPAHNIEVTLNAEADLVDPKSLGGYLLLKDPKDKTSVLELKGTQKLPIGFRFPALQPGSYELSGKVFARTPSGEPIVFKPETGHFDFEFEAPPTAEKKEPSDFSWLDLSIVLAGGNVILALFIGPTLWFLKQPKKTSKKAAKTKDKKQ